MKKIFFLFCSLVLLTCVTFVLSGHVIQWEIVVVVYCLVFVSAFANYLLWDKAYNVTDLSFTITTTNVANFLYCVWETVIGESRLFFVNTVLIALLYTGIPLFMYLQTGLLQCLLLAVITFLLVVVRRGLTELQFVESFFKNPQRATNIISMLLWCIVVVGLYLSALSTGGFISIMVTAVGIILLLLVTMLVWMGMDNIKSMKMLLDASIFFIGMGFTITSVMT